MEKRSKTDLVHVRIEPDVKLKAEEIFKKLGITTSYAVSMFLNQVILNNGIPFNVRIPEKDNDLCKLAEIIESTGGNGKVSDKNNEILRLFSEGKIDYETALFAIKRSFLSDINN